MSVSSLSKTFAVLLSMSDGIIRRRSFEWFLFVDTSEHVFESHGCGSRVMRRSGGERASEVGWHGA